MESPGAYIVDECEEGIFAWFLYFFAPPSRDLMAYHLQSVGCMTLYDAIWVNCENGATTDIKEQVPVHKIRVYSGYI